MNPIEITSREKIDVDPVPDKLQEVNDWLELPEDKDINKEPLVPLGINSEYPIYTINGKPLFVRQESAKNLSTIEKELPFSLHLIVVEAYRTSNRLDSHSTGGSIDIALFRLPIPVEQRIHRLDNNEQKNPIQSQIEKHTLISLYARPLNFGKIPQLDHFEREAKKRELTQEELEAQSNRRLLYDLMCRKGGFQPDRDKWWHYNFTQNIPPTRSRSRYGNTELSANNQDFEDTNRKLSGKIHKNAHLEKFREFIEEIEI